MLRLAFGHLVLLVVADVGVELAQVFVLECIVFQLHQHMALENSVVKNQVNKGMFAADEQALLPGFKAKAVT